MAGSALFGLALLVALRRAGRAMRDRARQHEPARARRSRQATPDRVAPPVAAATVARR